MNLGACRHLVAVALVAAFGCDPKPEIVGATLPTEETGGDDTTGGIVTTTGFGDVGGDEITGGSSVSMSSSAMSEVDEGSSSAGPDDVGAACIIPPDYAGGPTVNPDPSCQSGVCMLQAHVQIRGCEGPEDCTYDEHLTGCVDGFCALDTAWAEAHMECTRTCEEDVDCPDTPGCETGVVCAPIALIGPLCCQKVCTCLDEISQDWVNMREADCEMVAQCG